MQLVVCERTRSDTAVRLPILAGHGMAGGVAGGRALRG